MSVEKNWKDNDGMLALPDDPRVRRNSILTTADLPPQPDPAPMIIPGQRDEVVIQKQSDMKYHAIQQPHVPDGVPSNNESRQTDGDQVGIDITTTSADTDCK